MLKLKDSLADVQVLGYLRFRQDGKVIYFDPIEGDCKGASILRICNLTLTSIPTEFGELIDVRAQDQTKKGDKVERLAKAILEAQRIREESFDQESANKALDDASPTTIVNTERFYGKSMIEAASEGAYNAGLDHTTADLPIYLLIKYCWNDIGDWVVDERGEECPLDINDFLSLACFAR